MIDPFVLLAPLLLLPVFALVRFVGCAGLLGLDDVKYSPSAPALTSLSRTSAPACAADVTLTVTGNGFSTDSQVLWNGAEVRRQRYVSTTELEATITRDLLIPGVADVTVRLRPGGTPSAPIGFTVGGLIGDSVDFDPPPPRDANGHIGPFQQLDFLREWELVRQSGVSAIRFTQNVRSGRFTIVPGGVLQSIRAFAVRPGTVQLSDDSIPRQTAPPVPLGTSESLVATNWTRCSKQILVEFTPGAGGRGDDLRIVRIEYQRPV